MKVYGALIHYPVYNKNRKIIATSIATSNIHDISRTARTYGLRSFFIVTPVPKQQSLIHTMIRHWKSGYGAIYNPTRGIALDTIRVCSSLPECLDGIRREEGSSPHIVVTCARHDMEVIPFASLRQEMLCSSEPWLILFGTGWGLTRDTLELADRILEPIKGPSEYNHLSVRAAVAISLDRLLGQGMPCVSVAAYKGEGCCYIGYHNAQWSCKQE